MPKLSDDDRMAWIDSHWVTVVLVAMTLLILSFAASGSPSCMTKSEARAHYPRAHLYWHGQNRCWDNRHGRRLYRDPILTKVAGPLPAPVPHIPGKYTPVILAPGQAVFPVFLPWEQRVAGNFW